jgi:hypothetical protein
MLFTVGKDLEYERLMRIPPGFDKRHVRTIKERDCENCLYYDEQSRKCSLEKCAVFED